jgi:hypothetical protein
MNDTMARVIMWGLIAGLTVIALLAMTGVIHASH